MEKDEISKKLEELYELAIEAKDYHLALLDLLEEVEKDFAEFERG